MTDGSLVNVFVCEGVKEREGLWWWGWLGESLRCTQLYSQISKFQIEYLQFIMNPLGLNETVAGDVSVVGGASLSSTTCISHV